LAAGAFLIAFEKPATPLDLFKPHSTAVPRPPQWDAKEQKSADKEYLTMERKGFRVSTDIGCCIPEEGYYKAGKKGKGHQRAFSYAAGWRPVGVKKGDTMLKDSAGNPLTLEISHLCHRSECCRVDHMISEEKFQNQKRNYCRVDGTPCTHSPKCLRPYSNSLDGMQLCTTRDAVRQALESCPLTFSLLPNDAYAKRDAQSAKRMKRKHGDGGGPADE